MRLYTMSQASELLVELVESIHQAYEPIYIAGQQNTAVLIAKEVYQSMLETLHILSVPGLKESILQENQRALEEYADDIDL